MSSIRRTILPLLALTAAARAVLPDADPGQMLWYVTPAEKWTDALPLGNGRMGTSGPVTVSSATAKPARGANPNPFYRVVEAGRPIVASGGTLPPLPVRLTETEDLPTAAGTTYLIVSE